jgi:hypothetical protein
VFRETWNWGGSVVRILRIAARLTVAKAMNSGQGNDGLREFSIFKIGKSFLSFRPPLSDFGRVEPG